MPDGEPVDAENGVPQFFSAQFSDEVIGDFKDIFSCVLNSVVGSFPDEMNGVGDIVKVVIFFFSVRGDPRIKITFSVVEVNEPRVVAPPRPFVAERIAHAFSASQEPREAVFRVLCQQFAVEAQREIVVPAVRLSGFQIGAEIQDGAAARMSFQSGKTDGSCFGDVSGRNHDISGLPE